MTQALNLANFANNLNTAGATSNTGLQNSSVTVTAGTGMSGGGAVALGSSITLTNSGVTSVTAGTGISVSASTGAITIANSAPAVTSGEAKAWVTFTYISSVLATTASYNVSSVTRSAVGQYSVTMTNALVDANYAVVMGGGPATGQTQPSNTHPHYSVSTGGYITPTTTVFSLGIVNEQNSSQVDPYSMAIVVHR